MNADDVQLHESYEYEGVCLPNDVLRSTMDDLKTFHVRQDDVFVDSFPKSGTTWTLEIASAVLHDGDIDALNTTHNFERGPFLEMTVGGHQNRDLPRTHKMLAEAPMSSPRLIKSHLPVQLLPPQVWKKKVKVIYVIRNPKDVVVSYFHHYRLFAPRDNLQFDDHFEMFMEGTNHYGKWWDHDIKFYQRRHLDHILFLRFEEMKNDLRGTVKQISEFLGKSFSDEILDAITDHCTFENMKKNPMANPDTMIKEFLGKDIPDGQSFMRKGIVGGWKTSLSKAQSKALGDVCREKLKGTGLSFDDI
ncbi:sulfotransferase 1A1-like [Asterias rubens]|uniref:sulfotransferase 1A1-like n=1 Tax=Asterias rubens TaxID=7604 RepID=UPI0014551A0F|nr:sulfotransferase 1A1-like [Asterias rubens]XP_033631085.1 sulfotransferase 1A1-like [Asterias rubens]XP_033631086.1 sulfotransferase 1A1-like [Asterias rubens]